ncbi:MAG: bifunctional UDP-3-O-[3-hydroxymyristoyl] N-acetylglucosamine deacetylase/3-hydroxyacyl-ACP dehydratase [Prevotellaceae bacterium]|jgi:UDP-3-O-[3-hydroxymyristoyl] N-acetylglucosamine deacetylase/3-hydroxyacyl-[acyl-carrier-protein] dehydratase|nr:bifunctional UDP-3-O-[3-hydroxymyristoyl] N-acetylglucosamine deacetylase/3-hydroxyacyl-ACP dehydratase [Prevotellaceae bacterium]
MQIDHQHTINKEVTFRGKGLHTGLLVEMTVCPAAANHGIKFQRVDLEGMPVINAIADYVTATSRGTTIDHDGVKVSTIEHIMAALFGLGVDNALIRINAPEAPIMDGSALKYVEDMKDFIEELPEKRTYFEVTEKIVLRDEKKKTEIALYPDDHFSVNVNIDFGSKVLGYQYAEINSVDEIPTQIAPCRTFVFFHELEFLRQNNQIKGGDVDNAIVIVEQEVTQSDVDRVAHLFNKPSIARLPEGYLNNLELRFANEPARHKLLDLIGDLMLVGAPIKGKIIAKRPGHQTNTEFAKELRKIIKKQGNKPVAPKYNPNDTPLYDVSQIKKMLPHRPPFLLVDKIIRMDAQSVVGLKNVTMNESFFVGHFPDEPVMPGVLIVEAMAQCGGILALSGVPHPEHYSTYFLKMDSVKFKKMVVPGDTLVFHLKLVEPIRRGLVHMLAQAFVGDTLVAESDLLAQITKNR